MLQLDEIQVRYNGRAAVSGVSLEVPSGEFCVLLGSSGAGKSTLLRAVNGLVVPSSGQVRVDGITVGRETLGQVRARVGMVHQQFNLIPRLSVHSNVLTGALGRIGFWPALFELFPRAMRLRACELLDEVGLGEEFLYRRAAQLSGGEQQRVAIARAFMVEPKVVLADEPVASLDPQSSAAVLALLKKASRRHRATVLCSLHQVELARQFADRVVGIRQGRVVYDGAPCGLGEDVLRGIYASPDVAASTSEASYASARGAGSLARAAVDA